MAWQLTAARVDLRCIDARRPRTRTRTVTRDVGLGISTSLIATGFTVVRLFSASVERGASSQPDSSDPGVVGMLDDPPMRSLQSAQRGASSKCGLGSSEATIPTSQLVLKAVTLRGARGGRPRDFEAVIDLIAKGDLSIHATTTTFEEIPQAIERLKNGDVLGRIVAVLDCRRTGISEVERAARTVAQDACLACAGLTLAHQLRRDADPARKQIDLRRVRKAGLLDQTSSADSTSRDGGRP